MERGSNVVNSSMTPNITLPVLIQQSMMGNVVPSLNKYILISTDSVLAYFSVNWLINELLTKQKLSFKKVKDQL